MTFDEIKKTVENSSAEDWHSMESPTVYGWEFSEAPGQSYLKPHMHTSLAIYKPDIDISLTMGATVVEDFAEAWVKKFPDGHASSVAVQLRFRGSLVFAWVFVAVDGGRYLMPLPEMATGSGIQVPKSKMPFARLVFGLSGDAGVHKSLDEALKFAGVAIV